MDIDLEELKRKYAHAAATYFGQPKTDWDNAIFEAFPAIVAKLEAAQRLRDAMAQLLDDGVHPTWSGIKSAETALAAFDKETA